MYGNDNRTFYVSLILKQNNIEITNDINLADFVLFMPSVSDFSILNKVNQNKDLTILTVKNKDFFQDVNFKVINYSDCIEFKLENSALTVRALEIICEKHQVKLNDAKCLVSGYGFLAKEIIKMLMEHTKKIDVIVRKESLKSEIESRNLGFLSINQVNNYDNYEYVFNTIPSVIFNRNIIDGFPYDCRFFDLSSKPGGIDFDYMSEKDRFAKFLPGLPGKYFPEESGKLLAKQIIKIVLGD